MHVNQFHSGADSSFKPVTEQEFAFSRRTRSGIGTECPPATTFAARNHLVSPLRFHASAYGSRLARPMAVGDFPIGLAILARTRSTSRLGIDEQVAGRTWRDGSSRSGLAFCLTPGVNGPYVRNLFAAAEGGDPDNGSLDPFVSAFAVRNHPRPPRWAHHEAD